jgi:DNA-directed RNA polymerase specialized sigma24 family protein
MRDGDELAWGEFVDRFRPLLEHFASRTGIPRWERDTCITEVLDDTALKLATRRVTLPSSLGAYLIRAVRNQRLSAQRAAARRDRYHRSAADAEHLGGSVCSEWTLRASGGFAVDAEAVTSAVLVRLATMLRSELAEEDVLLLTWRSAGVPHRQIAAWLGITYDAAAKRVARLSQRAVAWLRAPSFPPEHRAEIARFLRRVGVTSGDVKVRRGGE